jgi:hypothetical protein
MNADLELRTCRFYHFMDNLSHPSHTGIISLICSGVNTIDRLDQTTIGTALIETQAPNRWSSSQHSSSVMSAGNGYESVPAQLFF